MFQSFTRVCADLWFWLGSRGWSWPRSHWFSNRICSHSLVPSSRNHAQLQGEFPPAVKCWHVQLRLKWWCVIPYGLDSWKYICCKKWINFKSIFSFIIVINLMLNFEEIWGIEWLMSYIALELIISSWAPIMFH